MRLDANIISIKEEGELSSIDQAYDKQISRSDKMVQRQSPSYLRRLHPSNNFVDQFGLIHFGLVSVLYTTYHQDLWVNSFIAVILHLKYMLSFQEWCIKIDPFIQSSESFHIVTQHNIDVY